MNMADDTKSTAQATKEYFSTIQGYLSILPTIASLVDAAAGWLPISTALKPWVYIITVVLTGFVIWIEVGRTSGVNLSEDEKNRMRRRAWLHLALAVVLLGAYWVLGTVLGAFLPGQLAIQTALLFVLAILIGGAIAEVSHSFAILALAEKKT
jgi:uncharacterized membrane protein